jgi:Cu-processing system ATP-binding protein
MNETGDPALAVTGLTKVYGAHTALNALTLSVRRGEMLALLGHNGAGKTTLMKLLLGLTRPTAGRISVLGAPPSPAGRADVGFLPENVVFSGGMTGQEVLITLARLKKADVAAVAPLLDRVGLGEAAKRPVRTYSKGMRQRLGLAQALIGHPRLLMLDEPTTGLDPVSRKTFYELLGELTGRGVTVLLSSHVLTELEARADRIAILAQGRLLAHDTMGGLRRTAGLPVRIIAHGVDGDGRGRRVLDVAPEDKMRTLRALMEGPLTDIEVHPPTLETIYAHLGAPSDGDAPTREDRP